MSAKKRGLGRKRVGVAIFLLVWVLASVFYGGIPLAIFLGLFIFIGSQEFVAMTKAKEMNLPLKFIIIANLLLLALTSFKLYNLLFGSIAIIVIAVLLLILSRGKHAKVNDVSMTLLAISYAGILPVHAVMIRNIETSTFSVLGNEFPLGVGLVLLTFLIVAVCDMAAFFSGKFFGKHPLWKDISPKKTIEGSIGGTLAGVLISLLVGTVIGLGFVHSLIIGLLLSVVSQLGDLTESMIKREVGIKDSGTLFPGHGGVLDRSDSYIFTVVAGYYYFKLFIVNNISAVSFLNFNIF